MTDKPFAMRPVKLSFMFGDRLHFPHSPDHPADCNQLVQALHIRTGTLSNGLLPQLFRSGRYTFDRELFMQCRKELLSLDQSQHRLMNATTVKAGESVPVVAQYHVQRSWCGFFAPTIHWRNDLLDEFAEAKQKTHWTLCK
jgi:hypothetical protein